MICPCLKHIEKLQSINLKLRSRIKDLNILVEKALEKQTKAGSFKDNNPAGSGSGAIAASFDPDHLLAIRQKEIENSKKQIELNTKVISKLK
jgi:hypothetical protein